MMLFKILTDNAASLKGFPFLRLILLKPNIFSFDIRFKIRNLCACAFLSSQFSFFQKLWYHTSNYSKLQQEICLIKAKHQGSQGQELII